MNRQQALDQMNYCIWCHTQGKDSCSTGLKDRKTSQFQISPFGVTLAGCPLDEKISEMHTLRAQGSVLGAFATIAIDNPMMAATGHRICNDCMKSCIYQKQDPVDIPQAETSILKDVLSLPWGFEIYSLLTRWNPLDIRRPLPRPDSGRKVLIVGLGPAGFTLAHHLMNDGHTVVAIDGLRIEPLGIDPTAPVHDAEVLFENLDDRVMAGFGGVAEYGITVRWNKNYLKLVRLLLERRQQFAHFGGVRFGGDATLTMDKAWAMGFDHIALCLGAGKPTVLDIPNGLARGVRAASDFLMALQLTGAAKFSSIANLQVRLPVVVIGGGLTAIDTATESLAYYVRQVEKFALRYRTLVAERGEAAVRRRWNAEEHQIADEFLAHAAAIHAERDAAAREGRAPRLAQLLDKWGGATIAYRRRLIDSPVLHAEPRGSGQGDGGRRALRSRAWCRASSRWTNSATPSGVRFTRADSSEPQLPARAVLVAAGTQPNTVLAREDGRFELDGKYFRAVDASGAPVSPVRGLAKPDLAQVLMHRDENGRFVSFFGDLHPSFFGNVVKAMGGAKRGYPVVSQVLAAQSELEARTPGNATISGAELIARCRDELRATVHAVNRLTPTIVEVVVRAPAAARAFRPGQFYRLQNYEMHAARITEHGADGRSVATVLTMEGLAMTGAWTDPQRGLVSVIVLEMGGSSDLCALLKPGEPVVLMGPTGTPTEIHCRQHRSVDRRRTGQCGVVLDRRGAARGGIARAVLRRLQGRAGPLQGGGNRARRRRHRLVLRRVSRASCPIPTGRRTAASPATSCRAWRRTVLGQLGAQAIPLSDVEHMIVIGSDRMMQAVGVARHGVLAPYLKQGHTAIGSINSPMQCMMKEVCAQCLQPQIDPVTGAQTVVFSCFNQDQALDRVDFAALHERLGQNSTQEKLTALWIDRALRRLAGAGCGGGGVRARVRMIGARRRGRTSRHCRRSSGSMRSSTGTTSAIPGCRFPSRRGSTSS